MKMVDLCWLGGCYIAHQGVQTGLALLADNPSHLSRAISQTDQLPSTGAVEPPPLATTTMIILRFGDILLNEM